MTRQNETPAALAGAGRGNTESSLGGAANGNQSGAGMQLVTRTFANGPQVVAAQCGGAISAARVEDGDVRKAMNAAIAGLASEPTPMPLAASRWLAEVAQHRLPPTALRAAMVFALHSDEKWLGVDALGHRIGVGFRLASAATQSLVKAGLLERSACGNRALYRRRLP